MDFPDITGALFLQQVGSGPGCAQPTEFAQIVGPLHIERKTPFRAILLFSQANYSLTNLMFLNSLTCRMMMGRFGK